MLGPIYVTLFICYRIAKHVVENYAHSKRAITDCIQHLCINVTAFDRRQSPESGRYLSSIDELHRNNCDTSILQVSDMQTIQVIDGKSMPNAQVVQRPVFYQASVIPVAQRVPGIQQVPNLVALKRVDCWLCVCVFFFSGQMCLTSKTVESTGEFPGVDAIHGCDYPFGVLYGCALWLSS